MIIISIIIFVRTMPMVMDTIVIVLSYCTYSLLVNLNISKMFLLQGLEIWSNVEGMWSCQDRN